MKILVAVASRHGSTREIADAISQKLRASGHAVVVRDVRDVNLTDEYDAVVLGSAVYLGNWLGEARQFVKRHQSKLRTVPVWLFSSGPLERDNSQPNGDPAHLAELMQQTGARGHQTFVGKLEQSQLGLGERLIVKAVKAPDGDFRDWEAIRIWAAEIAEVLSAPGAPAA